jgi:hypothetical protein
MPQKKAKADIWSKPKMAKLLGQPQGAPVKLTRKEALEIVQQAAGRRPDLPTGAEFVREVRKDFGYSIIERVKKQDE